MFGDSRPIDVVMLIIEFLVLAIIAAEAIHAIARYVRKRRITTHLFVFFLTGQELQDTVPKRSSGFNDPLVAAWNEKVNDWMNAVTDFLGNKCSHQAAVSFRHYITKQRLAANISPDAEVLYMALETRLDNLRSIIEKLDVYV